MAACRIFSSVLLLCWACTRLVFVLSARDDIINVVPPTLGDIALIPRPSHDDDPATTGRVVIFFTDGVNQSRWGTVCADAFPQRIARVICRQLGFSHGELFRADTSDFPENYDTWIHNVTCGEDEDELPQNLLRCKYRLYKEGITGGCPHDNDIVVKCSGDNVIKNPYEGQVWLCPPNGADVTPLHQTSMGLALVHLHHDWGTINEKDIKTSLGTFDANSFCRQLGYSQAVPDSTLTVSGARPRFDYSKCQNDSGKKAWFKAEEISNCHSSAGPCFGCCYDYPPSSTGCLSQDCDQDDDITLACMFDPYNDAKPTSGNEGLCQFETDSKPRIDALICTQNSGSSDVQIKIFSPIVGLLFVLVVVLVIVVVVLGYMLCRRRGYQPVPGHDQNGGPAPLGQQ